MPNARRTYWPLRDLEVCVRLPLKGLGEAVMAGSSAAIVNAIHQATGKRVRHMPIRIEDLL
jgi:CO/xanthine dehydrogenase Mo-binding subunit